MALQNGGGGGGSGSAAWEEVRGGGAGDTGRGLADGGDGLWGGAAPSHDGLVRQPVEDQVEGDGEPLRAPRLWPEERQPVLPGLRRLTCRESRRGSRNAGLAGAGCLGPGQGSRRVRGAQQR